MNTPLSCLITRKPRNTSSGSKKKEKRNKKKKREKKEKGKKEKKEPDPIAPTRSTSTVELEDNKSEGKGREERRQYIIQDHTKLPPQINFV